MIMHYVRYSFLVRGKSLLDEFRRECDKRGYKYADVLSALMRYYVESSNALRVERGRLVYATGGQDVENKKARE